MRWKGIGRELRREGCRVEYVKGWWNRGRPFTFTPIAVLFHHTASNRKAGNAPARGIVTFGRSDIPGPLSQFHVARNGVITIIARGYANHAGLGGPWGPIPRDSGNRYSIGIECENDGVGEPWPARQLEAIETLQAVLLRRLGRTRRSLGGHKEYTSRKIDPGGIGMVRWRARVGKRLVRLRRRRSR